jgi:uncharacterized membrane protein YedE/YeeE
LNRAITRNRRLIIGVVLLAAIALAVLASYWLFPPTSPTEELDEKFLSWTIVTACPFCVMNLRRGAEELGEDIPVCDLPVLLEEQKFKH